MKLPKRISEILKKKQEFINKQRTLMENITIKTQSDLLSEIITNLIPQLDVKDGIIQETPNNYKLLSILDKAYKTTQKVYNSLMFSQIVNTTTKISKMSSGYFEVLLSGSLPKTFESIVAKTDKLINMYIGVDGQKLVKGGFLESYFDSNKLGTDLKQLASKAVTSNMDIKDLAQALKDKINGVPKEVIKDGQKEIVQTGALEKQINDYVIDLYQTYDQAYNKTIGNELGLKYFIYQGGLIDDSRDFCAAHNNKVWSVDEAETWKDWVPADGDYPAGYEVKAKDIYSVPSYLGYPGYDSLINLGGFRCRHMLGWLTDDIAKGMRPDLE